VGNPCLANGQYELGGNNKDTAWLTTNLFDDNQLFNSHETLNLVIQANFDSIRSDVAESSSYHSANLVVVDGSDSLSIPVEIRTRGNFRRKCDNCDFPPLKFKFEASSYRQTLFHGQRKIKMVTHCKDDNLDMQQCMLKEYLAYRIYNLISPVSFRVRLAKVKYIDTSGSYADMERFGFFLEDDDDVARRNGLQVLNMANIQQTEMEHQEMAELALFQYMIGNSDWSIPKLHNVVLAREHDHAPPVAIPYDFDWSGFVEAPYPIRPNQTLDERLELGGGREYKSYKRPIKEMNAVIGGFLEQKEVILNLILSFPYLNESERQKTLHYIDTFYHAVSYTHLTLPTTPYV
jgi:uncharacterized protein YlaN (UPF0358 family)